MKNKRLIGLRGLTRGRGHWGDFPRVLNSFDSRIDFELLEIPGNGTRFSEALPLQAEQAVDLIRKQSRFVKNQEPFSILGISLGGMLALKWAELFPSEVSSLFVVNSSLSQLSPFYQRLQLRQLPQILKALREGDFEKREKIILGIISNDSQVCQEQLKSMVAFSRQYQVSHSSFFRQLVLASYLKINAIPVAKIKIICSEKDRLVDPSCSLRMADHFGVDPIVHPEAGHDIPLDEPQWLVKVMIDELSE